MLLEIILFGIGFIILVLCLVGYVISTKLDGSIWIWIAMIVAIILMAIAIYIAGFRSPK